MKILYNTSTGNSLYVAKRVAKAFDKCEVISINKMIKEEKYNIEDDFVGIIFPIHYAGVPIIVYNYLSKVNISKNAYVFAIGVSGGGKADTGFYLINKLLKRKIDNHLTVRYISNYIRIGRNPKKVRIEKALNKYDIIIDNFIEKLKGKEIEKCDFNKGLGNVEYHIFKDFVKNKDRKFNSNEKCTACGLCSKICPVNNILIEENKPKWKGNCVDCMACINICPKKSINIGNVTKNKNRYRNPNISVEELLEE